MPDQASRDSFGDTARRDQAALSAARAIAVIRLRLISIRRGRILV